MNNKDLFGNSVESSMENTIVNALSEMSSETMFDDQETQKDHVETSDEIQDNVKQDDFEASVGMSRKWDAREAGREVAENTLKKLKHKPTFFLLFSTIHYEKHGGFQEFLNGVWDVLPEGTPLIGGTVAGFMNPEGCFMHGASALAVTYPNMDVAIGIGHNTKRNPKKSALKCAKMIKNGLEQSKYENNFILGLISGGIIPQIPGMGRKRVIKGFSGKISVNLTNFSTKFLQKGIAREDEILEIFTNQLKNWKILGGSLMDDMNFLTNYQFCNNDIFKNSIISIGVKTDLNIDVSMSHGMKETDIQFQITKLSRDKRFIHEINGKPALDELLKLLNWPKNEVDENMYKRTFYYPFRFVKNGNEMPGVILMVLNNTLLVSYQIDNQKVGILTTNGNDLISVVNDTLRKYDYNKTKFGFFVSCATRLETLSKNIYIVRNKMLDNFEDKPFLLIYTNGESTYTPDRGLICCNDTFNSAVFLEN